MSLKSLALITALLFVAATSSDLGTDLPDCDLCNMDTMECSLESMTSGFNDPGEGAGPLCGDCDEEGTCFCSCEHQYATCVDVNHINDNAGFYTCDCVEPNDNCLSDGDCVEESACPESDGQSTCKASCAVNTVDWRYKCQWGDCGACEECTINELDCERGDYEMHVAGSNHGDLCRTTEANNGNWECPKGCTMTDDAPYCVLSGTEEECHKDFSLQPAPTGYVKYAEDTTCKEFEESKEIAVINNCDGRHCTVEECATLCTGDKTCKWFALYGNNGYCWLFGNCELFKQSEDYGIQLYQKECAPWCADHSQIWKNKCTWVDFVQCRGCTECAETDLCPDWCLASTNPDKCDWNDCKVCDSCSD